MAESEKPFHLISGVIEPEIFGTVVPEKIMSSIVNVELEVDVV